MAAAIAWVFRIDPVAAIGDPASIPPDRAAAIRLAALNRLPGLMEPAPAGDVGAEP